MSCVPRSGAGFFLHPGAKHQLLNIFLRISAELEAVAHTTGSGLCALAHLTGVERCCGSHVSLRVTIASPEIPWISPSMYIPV